MGKNKKTVLNVILFLLPALILFIGVLIAPIFLSAKYSLYDMKAYGPRTFVGLANYKEMFTSDAIDFTKALCNALLLAALSVFIQLPISLGLALLLGKGIKGERGFLSVFFFPVLISTVIIAQLFLKIYNPDYGIVNMIVRAITKNPEWTVAWLGNKSTALGAVFIPTLWQYVGYHMLLLYAGVKGVSPEMREAAMLDGATDGQVNRYIVIPSIKPIIKVSVIFAVTGSLKSFDLIFVLTNGGPLHATEVPSTLMINMLIDRNRYGMGSAIAVMMILLCFAFALLISRAFKEAE